MLTQQTQIPTASRGKVRALVKAHSDWPAYLAERGLVSANAKNSDLLAFACRHIALAAQVYMLLHTEPETLIAQHVDALVEAVEHLLRNFSKRKDEADKPRVRCPMGRAD